MTFFCYSRIRPLLISVFACLLCFQLLACSEAAVNERSRMAVTVDDLAAQLVDGEPVDSQLVNSETPLILDVRSAEEYAAGHIPGAVNIDYRQIAAQVERLQDYKNREVVLYCEQGVRAAKAEAVLAEAGFSELRHLEGDMVAWRAAKLPIELGRN